MELSPEKVSDLPALLKSSRLAGGANAGGALKRLLGN
jgi:hypothetical protein